MAKKIFQENVHIRENLPNNIEAEKTILGSALISHDALYNVIGLEIEDFYSKKNQLVFTAMKAVFDRKDPVDVVTVTEELSNENTLEDIGGVDYLKELGESVVSLGNLQFYVDIVNDQSTLRKLLISIRTIDDKYRTSNIENPNDFILESEANIKEALEKKKIAAFKNANEVATQVGLELSNSPRTKVIPGDECVGLNTGYRSINKFTSGFKPGEMTIIAARPGLGKTTLAMNFAYNVASKEHVPVAIFSLEMTAESLVKRLISTVSCVPLSYIMNGQLGDDSDIRRKVAGACKEISELPIYIDDTSGNRVLDIVSKCRKLMGTVKDLGLVVIDYLGLVEGGSQSKGGQAVSRQEEVRKITLQLHAMAKDLKVPIVVLSQLSRNVEQRGGSNKPMLSDLRDSGSIEQDAEVVMLLYRSDYYEQEDSKVGDKKGGKLTESDKYTMVLQQKKKELMEQIPGGLGSTSLVDVHIAKNRNGQTGHGYLFFSKNYSRFDQPSVEWEKAVREIEEQTQEEHKD